MKQKARPSGPTPRVYIAFAVAAALGLAVFAVWWLTSPDRHGRLALAERGATGGAGEAPSEFKAPRGGSVTARAEHFDEALARLMHATLIRINRSTDRVEPFLAESWTTSADNRSYRFRLVPDVVWSDATPLSAEDVAHALQSAKVNGKSLGIRTIDARTVEATFPEDFAPALRLFDSWPIVPRHAPKDQVGLGPFVPDINSGRSTSRGSVGLQPQALVRNPHYWRRAADGGALPYLDELRLVSGSSQQVDLSDVPITVDEYQAVKKAEQSGAVRVFELGPGLDADALWFVPPGTLAADKPWLTTEAFRTAISTAVDRRDYCKQVFFNACDPIITPVAPSNAAWFNADLPLGRGDPARAREILADLGLKDHDSDGMANDPAGRPVRFTMLIRRDVPASGRAATFLSTTLRTIGIEVSVLPLDEQTLRARRTKGTYEAIYDRIEFSDTDPALSLDFWLSSGGAHPWNPVRRTAPADWELEIDRLMLKNAASYDRIERLQAFVDVQRLYSEHMPAIFFGTAHVRVFTTTTVLNATPSPLRPHLLWNAENLAVLPK